jgi:hypothetical protein
MNFLSRLLGKSCAHCFSWPRTDSEGRYYQICSRCGVAYEYDWATMHRTDRRIAPQPTNAPRISELAGAQAAARWPLIR